MAITLNNQLKNHFMKNAVLYIIIIFSFTVGICTGAVTVNTLNYNQYDELSRYMQDFFYIVRGQNIDNVQLFKLSMMNNIKITILLWLLGISVIGIPFILVLIGIKGFIVGFTVGMFIKVFDMKGVFFSVLGVLPQNLISVPCYIISGMTCINFSLSMMRNKKKAAYLKDDIKMQFITYSTLILFILFFLTIGSVIEAYITPVFIKLISSTFVV